MTEEPPRAADAAQIQFTNFRPFKPTRPRTKDRRHGDLLKALTVRLVDTYSQCSGDFRYTLQLAPRRVLTKLSKGVHNQGYDNAEHDYICRVCDKIVNPDDRTYEILERLGHGTFGQVLKCVTPGGTGPPIALKIIKNKPAYFHQALVEVHILKMLNEKYDPGDDRRIVRMLDFFVYRKHLCIAFELLSVNLYDVLKQNSFRGVSMALIRVLTEQLLKAMQCLREAYVIHCDLKPENVLLSNMQHTRIKLIDFGSACFQNYTVYSYIQSRFYRSPEVLLGLPYTTAIDMWSLGCICAELFLGLPIFPGHSEYDQVCRIVEVQGLPPLHMLDAGKHTRKYFRRVEEVLQPANSGDGDMASGSSECGSVDSGDDIVEPGRQELLDRALRGGGAVEPTLEPSVESVAAPAKISDEEKQEKQDEPLKKQDAKEEEKPEKPSEQVVVNELSLEEYPPLVAKSSPADAAENTSAAAASASSAAEAELVPSPHEEETGSQQADDTDSTAPASQQLPTGPKSESLIDLIKRKVGLQPEPAVCSSAPVPPSSSGCESGGGDSENGSQAAGAFIGSNVSTAMGANGSDASAEAGQAQRRAPSGDELSDGRGEGVHRTGFSGFRPMPRARRRRVRTFWRLKTREEYERDEHKKEPTPKKYFDFKSLEQMVEHLPYKHNMSRRARAEEADRRHCFLQFLWGVLMINPDERWTPLQAFRHPFITGGPYEHNFIPCDDEAVPSFMDRLDRTARSSTLSVAAGQVPRLPAGALGQNQGKEFSGGGSARTWLENQNGFAQSDDNGGQPRSAPSTFRKGPETAPKKEGEEAPPPGSAEKNAIPPGSGGGGKWDGGAGLLPPPESKEVMRGLWGHLCAGVPLPDDNPAESYRPPIDALSEDYFRRERRREESARLAAGVKGVAARTPQKPGGNVSSASSTGSTPSYGHGRARRDQNSPYSAGSPGSAPGSQRRSNPQPRNATASGPASTHGVSPQGTVSPHTALLSNVGPNSSKTHQGGVPHTAPGAHQRPGNCTSGSQGSRGSSPWHLPSPMSELSTASDRVNSSQPSGSDSCGDNLINHHDGGHSQFSSGEDPSHSDGHWPRSHLPSDSDGTLTPQSHGTGTSLQAEDQAASKDPRDALWLNIKSEMARVQLSGLPRRLDGVTQSPGSAGAMGNFREKMGMNESGPVIPFGHGARRDANTAGTAAPGYFSAPQSGPVLGGNPSGHGGHGHRRRMKNRSGDGTGSAGSEPPGSGSGTGTPGK